MAFAIAVFMLSCSNPKSEPGKDMPVSGFSKAVIPPVSERRDSVSSKPVSSYSERTDNPLNNWYFKVQLFETPQTFKYLVRLQFEEIRGEDTLVLPNLGVMPEPIIKKGPDQYSCIIGFKDQDGKFRDYKKVYVKNNSLRITALKHYSVSRK